MPRAVPIDPQKLLEAARDFANQTGGKGRPRPVWLRRAVSSAYYALFHDLTRQAAVHLLPRDSSQHQLRVARTFRHQNMKEMCEQVAGRHGKPNRHMKPLVQSLAGTPTARVADSFCDLLGSGVFATSSKSSGTSTFIGMRQVATAWRTRTASGRQRRSLPAGRSVDSSDAAG